MISIAVDIPDSADGSEIAHQSQLKLGGAARCGCPVDTSKRSLEAPTEPAGENAAPYE